MLQALFFQALNQFYVIPHLTQPPTPMPPPLTIIFLAFRMSINLDTRANVRKFKTGCPDQAVY